MKEKKLGAILVGKVVEGLELTEHRSTFWPHILFFPPLILEYRYLSQTFFASDHPITAILLKLGRSSLI